jgi:hypothetical protein
VIEKGENCDCAFCNSKCPECGSTHVRVEHSIRYEYNNEGKDRIQIGPPEISLKLDCASCYLSFEYGDWEPDERLEPLLRALGRHLGLQGQTIIQHEGGGKTDRTEVTDQLLRDAEVRAAQEGITLRELIFKAVEAYLKAAAKKGGK